MARKPVQGTSIDNVYMVRITSDEKKMATIELSEIKKLLPRTRKYMDKDFCYSTNGSIIAASLKMFHRELITYLEEYGEIGA